jgi:hypothetical protein
MKKDIIKLSAILIIFCFQTLCVYGEPCTNCGDTGSPSTVLSTNTVTSLNNQTMQGQGYGYGYGQGGTSYATGGNSNATGGNSNSDADAVSVSGDSGAIANISTNSTSNYESRTPPVSMLPPYLPTYSHGGWGTIQAYFPNGPTSNNSIYERAFYTDSKYDMKELKSAVNSMSYDSPLGMVGGLLNGVGTLFGGPDNFHHGRGFDIANSLVRRRRPENRPLYILIDSNINRDYLNTTGYLYVGKISIEAKSERNWDQTYKAAIAEVLPWDVDIMLVSGGMKGITVGSTTTFPSAGAAYAQTNYSLTLLGGRSTGITEGKGKAMVSVECYRYNPQAAQQRMIPERFYGRIHANAAPKQTIENLPQIQNNIQPSSATVQNQPLPQAKVQAQNQVQAQVPMSKPYVGVNVSQELYTLAGFNAN